MNFSLKPILLIVFSMALLCTAQGQTENRDSAGLPRLNVVQKATLGPAYSCRPEEELRNGYRRTALFLSQDSEQRNRPELLFNGACQAENYFDVNTAGDSMSLIADLGENVRIETVTAQKAFNLQGVHSWPAYSQFARTSKLLPDHTYAALINTSDTRALVLIKVLRFMPDKEVEISYVVKSYEIHDKSKISRGFAWDK